MSSWKTNSRKQRFRMERMAYEKGPNIPECICRGECIEEGKRRPIDERPCPYRGYKNRGGYCKRCYEGLHGAPLSRREQEFKMATLEDRARVAEKEYRNTLVKGMMEGTRCEYCGRTRDKCECVVGGMK